MRRSGALIAGLIFAGAFAARAEFNAPALTGPVIDQPGLMRTGDRREMERVLRQVNAEGTAQIQVAILDSLEGLTIEEAAIKLFDQWKLGKQGKDNGLLFLISNGDRKMRFEVGRGLEGVLPDIRAKQILSDQVSPLFRAGRPSAGIVVGVSEALRLIRGESATADESPQAIAPEEQPKFEAWMITAFVILILVLQLLRFFGIGGVSSDYRRGRDPWGGGGFGGGGGWGGGSGGGWSGGGGSSAGGGASSGW